MRKLSAVTLTGMMRSGLLHIEKCATGGSPVALKSAKNPAFANL